MMEKNCICVYNEIGKENIDFFIKELTSFNFRKLLFY